MPEEVVKSLKKRLKLLETSAKKRNIAVDLNIGFYERLLDVGCAYCGKDLHSEKGYCLDRINNNKGYSFDNVTPCCKVCNRAKGTLSVSEFLEWGNRLAVFQNQMKKKMQGFIYSKKMEKNLNNRVKNSSFFKNSRVVHIEGSR